MKADTAAPVDKFTLTLEGKGGGKTNSQTLILDVMAKIFDLKLYFAKDGEERILSLNPDPTNPTDILDDTTLWWGGFLMNQELVFDSIELYFNFYVQKTNPDVKESIYFEVYFDYDSILADAWKKTLTGAPGDTEAIWFVDTLVVKLDSPQTINKNDEIRVSLGARNFDLCRFRYGVDNNDPYVRFH